MPVQLSTGKGTIYPNSSFKLLSLCLCSKHQEWIKQVTSIINCMSLNKVAIRDDFTRQTVSFSFCKKDKMYIHQVEVHQQKNGVACGLFATTFASCLAYGNDPGKIAFETELLRTHLLKWFQDNYWHNFPVQLRQF